MSANDKNLARLTMGVLLMTDVGSSTPHVFCGIVVASVCFQIAPVKLVFGGAMVVGLGGTTNLVSRICMSESQDRKISQDGKCILDLVLQLRRSDRDEALSRQRQKATTWSLARDIF